MLGLVLAKNEITAALTQHVVGSVAQYLLHRQADEGEAALLIQLVDHVRQVLHDIPVAAVVAFRSAVRAHTCVSTLCQPWRFVCLSCVGWPPQV